jgi:hypothetical protein
MGRRGGNIVSTAEIQLTLPADDAFRRVAHLVLGGLATRHDLTVETLEDLTLALDAVLARLDDADEDVTVRLRIGEDDVSTEVGPFRGVDVRRELDEESEERLDLHRILYAVCDSVAVADRDGDQWVELTKHVQRAGSSAG